MMDSGASRLNLRTSGPHYTLAKYGQGGDSGEMSYLDEAIVVDREVQEHCPPVHRNQSLTILSLAIHRHERHKQLEETGDLEKAIVFGRKALSMSPQVDSNNYPASLNNLANILFTRYIYLGLLRDLDEVIALDREALEFRPRGHPARSSSLNNLAIDLSTRYKRLGPLQDIHEAISLGREAVDLRPKGHHDRPSALNNLAVQLSQLGVLQDLDEAIVFGREALDLRPTEQSHRFSSVNNLAVFLYTRYKELWALHDLDEAIVLAREALDLCPKGHLDRASSLNNLGLYLSTRSHRLGALQDLDEVIILAREALDLCPKGHLNRPTSLNNLSVHLSTRYKQLGASQDINEAIILRREALDLCSKGHPKHLCSLDGLARSLSTRYKQLGGPQDIEEAIVLSKEALDFRPRRHPDRSFSLNILASCLSARCKQLGALQDLEEAIVLGREALELCPNGHPQRLCSLDTLARILSTRYKKLGASQDLEEAIVLGKEALELCPNEHSQRLCSLDTLARNLSTRYEKLGASQDLEEVIVLVREALDLRPKGYPKRLCSLHVLARNLSARYKQIGALQDLEEAIVLGREALELCPNEHPQRLCSLDTLARNLSIRYRKLGASQDLEEAIVLGREAFELCPNEHPQRLCSLDTLARNLSTRYKKLGALQDLEEVIVLVREALDLRPKGHPKRLCSLHVLARNLSARYKQIGAMQDLEEAIVLEREALDLRPQDHPSLDPLAGHASTRYDQFGPLQDLEETIVLAREAFDLPSPQDILLERSKVFIAAGSWEAALGDANQVIMLDPSSPWGYERKHAALHTAGEYDLAIVAFNTMLSKMADSPDPKIRSRRNDYVSPSATIAAIHLAVEEATRDLPRVLIHTESGRLCAKSDQMKSFLSQLVFKELISSMTTSINSARIKQEVTQYYRYATFSHKWEEHNSEPVFAKIMQVVVYALEESPTHHKLQMFCKTVRDAGLHWAWSDTCCINKGDHVVIQEALVAMFKWYESSTMTIVHLRDVHSTGRRGDLVKSIWNQRGWTFQEYHASKVVRFYTNDWKPYLNLDVPNHKLAPEIVSEMEEATGVSAQTLMSLYPGTDDIRDKLRLASGRQTSYIEDSAYSLLGIFSTSLSIIYGERDKALGRLLAKLLTNSGDTSILAWTGVSGSFNSCLPESITVFDQLLTTHIPQAISHSDMDEKISSLLSIPFEQAENLYRKLDYLPTPVFTERRMKLPCLKFKLGPLSPSRNTSERGYRAIATELGPVEIHTEENLSECDPLYLVHPWIDHLLSRYPVGTAVETTAPDGSTDDLSGTSTSPRHGPPHSAPTKSSRRSHLVARFTIPFRGRTATGTTLLLPDTASLLPPTSLSAEEHRMQVLQCMMRLKAPFGALLLTPKNPRTNTRDLKRVAADCRITVRVPENVSLKALMACVDVVDVL